jgi:hypothetical protein
MLLHGALTLEGLPTLTLTGQKDVLVEGPSVLSCLGGGGPYCSPDAQMHILHMSLHGALMLEGSPALICTGQKDVLVEGPPVLCCPGGGGGLHCSADAQIHLLHMSLHGVLMLEGSPTLMWTGRRMSWWRNLLCSATMGRALLLT